MSEKPIFLRVALNTPLRRCFDYLPPDNFQSIQFKPGIRVLAPFGKRKMVGVLIERVHKTDIEISKIKPIYEILDTDPVISPQLMKLLIWASNYYHHPIGEVVLGTLPKLLRDGKQVSNNATVGATLCGRPSTRNDDSSQTNKLTLNPAQQYAIDTIKQNENFNVFLLDGVTGSGKTEVYLQVIANILADGKQALVLVPEIGLTPQTVARFQKRFPVKISVLHSRLTPKQRAQGWCEAKDEVASIVIGTRSSIFTPLPKLGIIILDEEHDLSFKQHSGFRYSARDLAIIRGQQENVPVVLGSATPSLESFYNVQRDRYRLLSLPERAGEAFHPSFHVIDIRGQKLRAGMATALLHEVREQITQNNQVLLFLNRRGYAPTLLCHTCGWVAECKNCDARMTLHQKPAYLHCHHCGATKPVLKNCPECGSDKLISAGAGTQRLEEKLRIEFPDAPLIRVDRDTTSRKGAIQEILDDVKSNNYQILIGTQMLAKGHHFPNVTLVAVLDADSGLLSADFRAQEHIAQLIMQVAGRAGRADKLGKVFVQTHNPSHPLLTKLMQKGYRQVAEDILQERKEALLPPVGHFALVNAEAKQEKRATEFLNSLKNATSQFNVEGVNILGPIPAAMQRKAGYYRAQLLIASANRKKLHEFLAPLAHQLETLRNMHRVRCSLDVDPMHMG